jgi:DNA-directed RNA polymerase specialized sigma24 family protein
MASGGDFPGKDILGHGSPREILRRIGDGDPLEIIPRSIDYARELAVLIDARRLAIRAMARTAHAAPRYSGTPPLDEWLRKMIDISVNDLIREDREEERAGIPPSEPWDPRFAFVSETFGVEPGAARRASIAFNVLPSDVRRAFFAIAVDRKKLNRYVAEGNGPPEKVRAHVRRALEAISGHLGDGPWKEGLDEL